MNEIKVRPVWVSVSATRDDEQCAHRVPAHGSSIRFIRCHRDRETEKHGWPLCTSHARQVER